jgi:hypothetical protein
MMTKHELSRRFHNLSRRHGKSVSQLFTIANSVNRIVLEFRQGITEHDRHLLRVYLALLEEGGLDLELLMEIYSHSSEALEHGAEFNPDPAVREFCADAVERGKRDMEMLQEKIEQIKC